MKNLRKSILAISLAAAMTISCFTGCGSIAPTDNTSSVVSQVTTVTVPSIDKGTTVDPSADASKQSFYDAFNDLGLVVELKPIAPSSDDDKPNTVAYSKPYEGSEVEVGSTVTVYYFKDTTPSSTASSETPAAAPAEKTNASTSNDNLEIVYDSTHGLIYSDFSTMTDVNTNQNLSGMGYSFTPISVKRDSNNYYVTARLNSPAINTAKGADITIQSIHNVLNINVIEKNLSGNDAHITFSYVESRSQFETFSKIMPYANSNNGLMMNPLDISGEIIYKTYNQGSYVRNLSTRLCPVH
mgnify:CR=1 FL=1